MNRKDNKDTKDLEHGIPKHLIKQSTLFNFHIKYVKFLTYVTILNLAGFTGVSYFNTK